MNAIAGWSPKAIHRVVSVLACLGSFASAEFVAAQTQLGRPNVLFLLADDLRADVLGSSLDNMPRTPNLDALAKRSQRFPRAVANYPVCIVSRAEILTGCSAFLNGIMPNYSMQLRPELVTWPAAMQSGGYRTIFTGKWHFPGRPKNQGYEIASALFAPAPPAPFRTGEELSQLHPRDSQGRSVTGYVNWIFRSADGSDTYPEKGVGLTLSTDVEIADATIRQIQSADQRPFFLHVNFTSPHDPRLVSDANRDRYSQKLIRLPRNFLPQHPLDNGLLDNRDELLIPRHARGRPFSANLPTTMKS